MGKDKADELAKHGTFLEQPNTNTRYSEEKKRFSKKIKHKLTQEHEDHNRNDPYYSPSRKCIIFRLLIESLFLVYCSTNRKFMFDILFNKVIIVYI